MSGIELIGLISGIISIVDASLQIYEAVEDSSGLPRYFRNVVARLPAVQDTLETTKLNLEEEEKKGNRELSRTKSRDALAKILASCYDKAAALNKNLQAVMAIQGTSKTKRCIKAIKIFPTAERVENLMNGILHDVNVLAANHSVRSATRTQINDLEDMIRRIDQREHMNKSRRAAIELSNTGKGSQFIYEGQGNQNVSLGTGMQLNGILTAPLYLTLTG